MESLSVLTSSLWSVLMIAVFFGGSIFVHELGHFWVARKRGVKVERFSIGFGPAIFKWKGKDGVEYRLSWLPLGGYVALPQLADMRGLEGEPTGDTAALPSPNYTTRMLVFGAGAAMNVILAFVLATVLWKVGVPTYPEMLVARIGHVLPTLKLKDGSTPASPAAAAGLRVGDVITEIDGVKVVTWDEMRQTLFTGGGRGADGLPETRLKVRRGEETVELTARPLLAGAEQMRMLGVAPYQTFTVGEIKAGSFAERGGLKAGDRLAEIGGVTITSWEHFSSGLIKRKKQWVPMMVERDGERVALSVPSIPKVEDFEFFGMVFRDDRVLVHIAPWEQIWSKVTGTARTLYSLVNRNSDVNIGHMTGPIGIARVFHMASQIDIRYVISFTVLINVSLAMFNLLPLPVLDGGHMVLATLTKLRGKPVSPQIMNAVQGGFVGLLLMAMVYIGYRDVRRIVLDREPEEKAPAAKTETKPTVESTPVVTPEPSATPAP